MWLIGTAAAVLEEKDKFSLDSESKDADLNPSHFVFE